MSTTFPVPPPQPPEAFTDDEFAALFTTLHGGVFRYLARRVGPTIAEDLTAETFVRAWEGRDRVDASLGNARGWVFGIATNLLRHHYRHEERQLRAFAATGIDPVVADHEGRVIDGIVADEQAKKLAAALGKLSADDRTLLLLHHWAGLTIAELAEAVDAPEGTVTSRLSRARTRLRRLTGGTGLD